jgi:hypothetical protein
MKIIPSSRKRHYMAKVSIFLITAALIAGMGGSYGVGGDDTPPSQNLEIRTWYDLDAIRNNLAGNHTLMNDLNSTTPGYEELASPTANGGNGWQPIGYFSEKSVAGCGGVGVTPWWYGLTGSFDGQGYEIRDLFINRPDEQTIGLFASVNEGGIIENVGVVNATVIGKQTVGSLVGWNERGTVSNSYSTGNVSGYGDIGCFGGLVGDNYYGTVSNSYSAASVSGDKDVGGLVGWNREGTVNNSYSTGNVTGYEYVGGLVGQNWEGTVSNSFWNTETSGRYTSDGGTGKNTTEMQNIDTFSGAGWNIIAVAPDSTNTTYIWNIVNNITYPFLSWQS